MQRCGLILDLQIIELRVKRYLDDGKRPWLVVSDDGHSDLHTRDAFLNKHTVALAFSLPYRSGKPSPLVDAAYAKARAITYRLYEKGQPHLIHNGIEVIICWL